MTLTGVAADSRLADGKGGYPGRRLIAVGAMLAGALVGALLVVHVDLVVPLGVAAVLLAVSAIAHRLSAGAPDWA